MLNTQSFFISYRHAPNIEVIRPGSAELGKVSLVHLLHIEYTKCLTLNKCNIFTVSNDILRHQPHLV